MLVQTEMKIYTSLLNNDDDLPEGDAIFAIDAIGSLIFFSYFFHLLRIHFFCFFNELYLQVPCNVYSLFIAALKILELDDMNTYVEYVLSVRWIILFPLDFTNV